MADEPILTMSFITADNDAMAGLGIFTYEYHRPDDLYEFSVVFSDGDVSEWIVAKRGSLLGIGVSSGQDFLVILYEKWDSSSLTKPAPTSETGRSQYDSLVQIIKQARERQGER